ncbi:hypothetical protein F5Y06DRAFT_282716 [Hypoxylon sp. FL0890]|nr:hypothetical protein F5Y06DRAFT_282716 [Hypoxylon sp. FL0890]
MNTQSSDRRWLVQRQNHRHGHHCHEVPIECILCRSRKVKCDKHPSGCLSCEQLGVRCLGYSKSNVSSDQVSDDKAVDDVFKAAGIKRRKNGACQGCRHTKTKCNQDRPQCRRCPVKSIIPCIYVGKHRNVRNAVRSHADDIQMDDNEIPVFQEI